MNAMQLPLRLPALTPYQHETAIFSILEANEIDYMSWFSQNFIQLRIIDDMASQAWLDFFSYVHDGFYMCPFVETQSLSLHTLRSQFDNIIDFIVKNIESGHYVYLVVDAFYIPLYHAFGKYKFGHPILIYGYDREQEIFYAGDFFDFHFKLATVSFSDMKAAFEHVTEADFHFNGAKLIKVKEAGNRYSLDILNVIELLEDYLYNRDTRRRYRSERDLYDKEKLGMGHVYSRLTKDVALSLQQEEIFHLASFHAFYEHKKALRLIYEYLVSQGAAAANNDGFEYLEKQALALRNMLIKYALTNDARIQEPALQLLGELWKKETEVVQDFVKELAGTLDRKDRQSPEFSQV